MASGWNPEAAYTSPGKPGLLWVCPSAGALDILYNVLPFCGEEQAHGAQLGLLGSQRGFKHGDYGLHLGQHNGVQAAISWVSIFSAHGMYSWDPSPLGDLA